MKKRSWKRGLAVAMGVMLGVSQPAGTALRAYQAYAYTDALEVPGPLLTFSVVALTFAERSV